MIVGSVRFRSTVNFTLYKGTIVPATGEWFYLIPHKGAIFYRMDGLSAKDGGIRCELGEVVELHRQDLSLLRVASAEDGAELETVSSPIQLSIEDLKEKPQ